MAISPDGPACLTKMSGGGRVYAFEDPALTAVMIDIRALLNDFPITIIA